MCGIAGYIDFNKKLNADTLQSMTNCMAHRGPDDKDYLYRQTPHAHIGMGHRRLSIIDLSSGARQPMQYRHLHLVFNGEIYNYQEIKKELLSLGYKFETNSDTEVVLAAILEWGMEALHRFIGMFAFLLYDELKQKMYIVRDRAGVKPLFFYQKNGQLLFASELKAFHQVEGFDKTLNYDALSCYFQFTYIIGEQCIFKNCKKVNPGHYLEIDLATQDCKEHKYWDVVDYYNLPKFNLSEAEIMEQMEALMSSAFQYRMVSDVPVGVFLSGGYDSSIVTAILQRNSTQKINTFTIGFHESEYNEATYAKEVAQYLGTNHTEYYCTAKEALETIPKLAFYYDEPFGDSSAIPTMLVSEIARKSVTVALSADGGDEIFAGYSRYVRFMKRQQRMRKIPTALHQPIAYLSSAFARSAGGGADTLNKHIVQKANKMNALFNNYDDMISFKLQRQIMSDNEIRYLMTVPFNYLETPYDKHNLKNNKDILNDILALDYKSYLTDDILVKTDRASMAVALEGREPFLDQRIIEFAARIPSNEKYKHGVLKYILKNITHQYLPKSMMERPKKGFSVPIMRWLKRDLKHFITDYINEDTLREVGIFNVKLVMKERDDFFKSDKDEHIWLWLVLVYMLWYKQWM